MVDTAPLYPAAQIRAAEEPLLGAQREPDELMRAAAHAVAEEAARLLDGPGAVLLLAGSGGNGGDALYAGAELAAEGRRVDALLVGSGVHERARDALLAAGGRVLDDAPEAGGYALAIDGIAGLGGRPALKEPAARAGSAVDAAGGPILAVDVPSGVAADTGEAGASKGGQPGHVTAAATVTFGGLRRAHALSAACGKVALRDISLPCRARDLAGALAAAATGKEAHLVRVVEGDRIALRGVDDLEPGEGDDKYSGGVVGVLAGSERYPGAGVLAAAGAGGAAPAMVRVVGGAAGRVLDRFPEAVWSPTLEETGRVQAFVVGPGRGTGDEARAELAALLERPEPLVADADALTVLASSPELLAAAAKRQAPLVITPHAGEFRRLADALDEEVPDPEADRIGAAEAMATALGCVVLLKGARTVVAGGGETTIIEAGHGWAATPGSGDVLSGILGAWAARPVIDGIDRDREPGRALHRAAVTAAAVHQRAAWLAATTPTRGVATALDIAGFAGRG